MLCESYFIMSQASIARQKNQEADERRMVRRALVVDAEIRHRIGAWEVRAGRAVERQLIAEAKVEARTRRGKVA